MGSELQAMASFRTDHQPALEFGTAAIRLASEEVAGVIYAPLPPPPTGAGAQTLSSWDGKGASQSRPGCGKQEDEVTLVLRQLGTLPTRLPSTASTFILEK